MRTVSCTESSSRPSSQTIRYAIQIQAIVLAVIVVCNVAVAQPGRGPGFGRGRGRGMSGEMRADMTTLHAIFAARDRITRSVKMLPNGAEAITESDDATITALLREHVPAMEVRVHNDEPLPPMTFHPVFVHLIKHADDYTLTYAETDKGLKVTYKSDDPFVIMLVQEHAKLVSRFVRNGMAEIHKPYKLPRGDVGPAEAGGESVDKNSSALLGIARHYSAASFACRPSS